jgi:hypothetical protein
MNEPTFTRKLALAGAGVLAGCLLSACNTAKVTAQRDLSPAPAEKPTIIYVADFGLDAENIQHEEGILSERPGPLGRVGNSLYGTSSDPAVRASQLVNLMAKSLVKDLAHAGFNARRLPRAWSFQART